MRWKPCQHSVILRLTQLPKPCPSRTLTLRSLILNTSGTVEDHISGVPSPVPASQAKGLCVAERYLCLGNADGLFRAPIAWGPEMFIASSLLGYWLLFLCDNSLRIEVCVGFALELCLGCCRHRIQRDE